jgi:hypothetical protein
MRPLRVALLVSVSLASPLLLAVACGDDHAIVRERIDSGLAPDDGAASEGGACPVAFPSTYDSPTFETNAATELGLRKNFDDFLAPMLNVEATLAADAGSPTPITKAQLLVPWTAGNPSVKSATTPYFQAKVDAWLSAYETAVTGGAYTPDVADGGGKGGIYGDSVFDPTGIDLRQAIEKGSYGATFYSQAAALIAAGSLTVGSIDRLVAGFGAHPSFPNDPNASQNKDVNAAALAARRDSKQASNPGPYQRIRSALIKAKAAVTGGPACADVVVATLKIFLSEWEKSNYATVIFDLNDVIVRLGQTPLDGPSALHSFGEAVGLISGFKQLPQTSRIITDAQIDGLLQKVSAPDGAPSQAYNLVQHPVSSVASLQQAIALVQGIYQFSDADVEAFKKDN